MKRTNIIYWILTGLFAFVMFGSAIPDVLVSADAVKGFADMGLPKALIPFLGVAKILGVIAILVPGFPRVKEWAYAGLIFDLIGATYLIAAAGIPVAMWSPMLLFIALGFGSYAYYHKRRRARAEQRSSVSMAGSANYQQLKASGIAAA